MYRGGSTQYILANTNPSSTYTFYVDAINFNGVGTLNQETFLKSCVAPYSILPPTLVSSTSTTVTLSWTSPGNNGGWQVTGFGLLRDNGNGGDITTSVDSGTISGNPNLFEYKVTLAGLTGKLVRFQLQVTNEMGTTTSIGYLAALVAGLPGTPANIVALSDNISGTQIAFMIPEVTDDGGSSIETFQVMIDDGAGGTFNTISGYLINSLKTDFIINSGIQMGSTYRVMYVLKNKIGWATSGITYIFTVQAPSTLDSPVYVSSSSTTLVIRFGVSESNGGSTITSYNVQIDKEDKMNIKI